MDCRRVQNKLSEYIDEELSASERARVFAHLSECPECRAEEAALRRTASLAQTWGLHPPAPELEWRLAPEFLSERAGVPERVPWGARLKAVLAPASVVAAAFLLMLGSGNPLRPVPPVGESDGPVRAVHVARQPVPAAPPAVLPPVAPAVRPGRAPATTARPAPERPLAAASRPVGRPGRTARPSAAIVRRASGRGRLAARAASARRPARRMPGVALARAEKPKAPEPIVAAESLYASGRYREAAVVLNAAIERSSIRASAQQRSTYVERNALADATIAECSGALLQDPGNANARKFLDEAYSSKVALLRSLAG